MNLLIIDPRFFCCAQNHYEDKVDVRPRRVELAFPEMHANVHSPTCRYEHREELVLGMDNEPHALFQQHPPRMDLIWAKVLGNVMPHPSSKLH